MSEPHDAADAVRETLTGRTLLGCGVAAALLLPAWFVAAAFLIQIDPALNGFQAIATGMSDTPVQELPRSVVWSVGAMRAALLLAVLVPLALGGWLLTRVASLWFVRRARRDRERYDALVRDAAVLRDPDWERPDEG